MSQAVADQDSIHERTVLGDAWKRFATYDLNANAVQRKFFRLRISILAVGVAATALAIVYAHVEVSNERPPVSDWRFYVWLAVIVAPILGTVLAAGASKLARAADWIHLRGAAEATKREIYRYRCGVGVYGSASGGARSRDESLAAAVTAISGRLMDTEILATSLLPYGGQLPPAGSAAADDDGFSDLSPATYLRWRLADQQAFFKHKSLTLDRRHRRFQWAISTLGGLGTLLAAIGLEIWVPVSVGLATALASYLELRNTETNLAGYNRAALELDNILTWWSGLPPAKKEKAASFAALIDRTEALLASENSTWAQGMQDALAHLAKEGEASD